MSGPEIDLWVFFKLLFRVLLPKFGQWYVKKTNGAMRFMYPDNDSGNIYDITLKPIKIPRLPSPVPHTKTIFIIVAVL